MRLGAENRTKLAVAVGLFALAIFLLVRMLSGGKPTPVASATPVTQRARPAARPRRGARAPNTPQPAAPTVTLDPRLRLDLLKNSETTVYQGSGRNIFRAEAQLAQIPTPVVSPIKKAPEVQPPPPGPPPPPPINLKFFGFANHPGEPRKVFLAQGDDVFVAGEGDIVNRRYKVLRITANSVEIEDLLSNNRQTIPLTQS